MSSILAIDIGTGSTKALAVDRAGDEIFSAQESYPTHHPKQDYSEQNPEEIFQAVKKVIQKCPADVKANLSAISFSSAMHSMLVADEQGVALTPLIIWSDLRSTQESKLLRNSSEAQELSVRTGTPVHPMSLLCKILWMRKNSPQFFSRSHKFIGIKEYIWNKLVGHFEVDYGVASATGLLATGELKWFEPALAKTGIEAKHLSKLVSVYHRHSLKNSMLAELGFTKPVECVIGSSDGCLANLGSFAMDPSTLSLTIGTSGAVRRTVNLNIATRNPNLFCYHLDEETFIEGGATNNGAVLVDWFSGNFLKEKLNIRTFIERAESVPAGAEGLLFLPYVLGERAPLYDPDATGTFLGIRKHHSIEHFMRALLEGIGFALYSIAELMKKSGTSWSTLVASGGFAQSDAWVQLMSNIFGKPVHVQQHEHASALGAAMIGFKAMNLDYSFRTQPKKVFQPEATVHEDYRKIFEVFRNMSDQIQHDRKEFSTKSRTA